ncbi:sulfate ABC transporter ATP-binding protein [Campylobacter sp. MOP7]|uniref:sulfate ABC transporter ATP-binding protein n=1 Tax=Campylobacter canis TaxID=3378588 RepID=UPI00387EC17A
MKGDENLKNYFSKLDLSGEISDKFLEQFMKDLITNRTLVISGIEFAFAEIEIYLSSKDKNVYKRSTKAGEIFFHNFGFDICFETKDGKFGGVLIRSLRQIYPENKSEFILGPRRCMSKILNSDIKELNFTLKISEDQENFGSRSQRIRREIDKKPLRFTSESFENFIASNDKEAKIYKTSLKRYER